MTQFLTELKQRHVVRAAIIYAAAVWALAQGISQLSPAFGLASGVTFWFVIACAIGFPFWLLFAWYFKFTTRGIERESDTVEDAAAIRRTGRKLDYWIIGILAVAVVLLLTNQLVLQRGKTLHEFAATPTPIAATAIPAKSVAVLPFANESGNKDQQYFSDGLSEDLITALSQFAGLKVISRNSAFQFRNSKDSSAEIGRLLGVAHLLEGSVQRAGNDVRITATLVNASDGSILWSQRYDKPYKDLFALQDAITKAVAGALKAKLLTIPGAVVQTDRSPSGNLDAYTAFLRGIALDAGGTQADEHKAIAAFAAAIRLDPQYARAYAAQARAWERLGTIFLGRDAQQQAYDAARQAVDKALQLDPNLAAGYVARSYLEEYAAFDWNSALADAQRAVRLAPDASNAKFQLALVMGAMGHLERAAGLVKAALKTDPRNGGAYFNLSWYYAGLGRLEDAAKAIRTAIAVQPQGAANHEQLAIIEVLRGDASAAMAAAKQEIDPSWRSAALALALQVGPDHAAADAALKALIATDANASATKIAEVYALRHDPDNMFKWLDQAWQNRDAGLGYLLGDPLILRYRDDPRFAAFCKQVGLPTTTDAIAMK